MAASTCALRECCCELQCKLVDQVKRCCSPLLLPLLLPPLLPPLPLPWADCTVAPHIPCGCRQCRSLLSRVCQRWRALCFSSPDLWESLTLTAPYGRIAGERSQWLAGKLWLLQVRCA